MNHQSIPVRNRITTTFFLGILSLAIFIFATLLFGQRITFDKLVIKKQVKRARPICASKDRITSCPTH